MTTTAKKRRIYMTQTNEWKEMNNKNAYEKLLLLLFIEDETAMSAKLNANQQKENITFCGDTSLLYVIACTQTNIQICEKKPRVKGIRKEIFIVLHFDFCLCAV